MFELIGAWIGDTGRSVISVVHDLSLARAYGAGATNEQEPSSPGAILSEALSDQNLSDAYGIDVRGWMRDLYARWT